MGPVFGCLRAYIPRHRQVYHLTAETAVRPDGVEVPPGHRSHRLAMPAPASGRRRVTTASGRRRVTTGRRRPNPGSAGPSLAARALRPSLGGARRPYAATEKALMWCLSIARSSGKGLHGLAVGLGLGDEALEAVLGRDVDEHEHVILVCDERDRLVGAFRAPVLLHDLVALELAVACGRLDGLLEQVVVFHGDLLKSWPAPLACLVAASAHGFRPGARGKCEAGLGRKKSRRCFSKRSGLFSEALGRSVPSKRN